LVRNEAFAEESGHGREQAFVVAIELNRVMMALCGNRFHEFKNT
jgi:hypothetical protein